MLWNVCQSPAVQRRPTVYSVVSVCVIHAQSIFVSKISEKLIYVFFQNLWDTAGLRATLKWLVQITFKMTYSRAFQFQSFLASSRKNVQRFTERRISTSVGSPLVLIALQNVKCLIHLKSLVRHSYFHFDWQLMRNWHTRLQRSSPCYGAV